MKKVGIIGEGAWGTAVATLLAFNGYEVFLWCNFADVAHMILETGENKKYLPGIHLNAHIKPVTNFDDLAEIDWLFEAIPVQYLRSVLEKFKPFYHEKQRWVILSKGIEDSTLMFPGQMLDNIFQKQTNFVVLAGPSFAHDLAKQNITGVMLASSHKQMAQELQSMLNNDYFTTTLSDDVIGVEVGAALKNVLALGVGMIEGAGYGANTVMLFFTRVFHEICLLAKAMGAKEEALMGLAGLGDAVLTSFGGQSRNVCTGKLLGQGWPLAKILSETGMSPEGINTVKSVYALSQKFKVVLPLTSGLYHVIFGKIKIAEFLSGLVTN